MKEKILFIKKAKSSFVEQDENLLREHFQVETFLFGNVGGLGLIGRQFALLGWLLIRIWSAKKIFIWFCDYHAFFPSLLGRIFGKRTVIVIGGFDAMRLPKFNYGGFASEVRGRVIRCCCKLAHVLLPVSEFTLGHLIANAGVFVKPKSKKIYNGIDLSIFPGFDLQEREQVICISAAAKRVTAEIKGIDRFIELAEAVPERSFVLVGSEPAFLESYWDRSLPQNLRIIPWTPREELLSHLNTSKVICQLSRSESFGVALAEGMLCGCIPLTLANLGSAEVVDQRYGYILPNWDLQVASDTIQKAFTTDDSCPALNRTHIVENFGINIRGKKLLEVLSSNHDVAR